VENIHARPILVAGTSPARARAAMVSGCTPANSAARARRMVPISAMVGVKIGVDIYVRLWMHAPRCKLPQ
jgi:hypothetical protein